MKTILFQNILAIAQNVSKQKEGGLPKDVCTGCLVSCLTYKVLRMIQCDSGAGGKCGGEVNFHPD